MTSHKIMQGIPVPPGARVPRQDWDRAPWNRWSFHNIREILPTKEVWRGTGPVWRLDSAAQDLGSIPFTLSDGGKTTVSNWLDDDFTDGFIVLHYGKIVYERYFTTMTERSLHLSQSVAKSVTSAVAGMLVGRGLLDPEQPVTDYLPELKRTAWKGANCATCWT
jgi:CubicO group peptidase (beta-lactamase class C family)